VTAFARSLGVPNTVRERIIFSLEAKRSHSKQTISIGATEITEFYILRNRQLMLEPFKLMEPFTSLLITRNLKRAPLIILTFVQRLLVRDHYLQVLALKLRMSLSSTQRVSL